MSYDICSRFHRKGNYFFFWVGGEIMKNQTMGFCSQDRIQKNKKRTPEQQSSGKGSLQ